MADIFAADEQGFGDWLDTALHSDPVLAANATPIFGRAANPTQAIQLDAGFDFTQS